MMTTAQQKERLENWFQTLQQRICEALEEIENEFKHPSLLPGRFTFTPWKRSESASNNHDGGGGKMGLCRGLFLRRLA